MIKSLLAWRLPDARRSKWYRVAALVTLLIFLLFLLVRRGRLW